MEKHSLASTWNIFGAFLGLAVLAGMFFPLCIADFNAIKPEDYYNVIGTDYVYSFMAFKSIVIFEPEYAFLVCILGIMFYIVVIFGLLIFIFNLIFLFRNKAESSKTLFSLSIAGGVICGILYCATGIAMAILAKLYYSPQNYNPNYSTTLSFIPFIIILFLIATYAVIYFIIKKRLTSKASHGESAAGG